MGFGTVRIAVVQRASPSAVARARSETSLNAARVVRSTEPRTPAGCLHLWNVLTPACVLTGKFWHRHQRPRPVTYNPDPVYHLSLGVSPSIQLNGTGHSESHSNTPMPPPATDDVPPPLPGHSDRPKSPVHPSEVRKTIDRFKLLDFFLSFFF
jgi:hypothetical protein